MKYFEGYVHEDKGEEAGLGIECAKKSTCYILLLYCYKTLITWVILDM